MPKISIITVTFNAAATIGRTIESVKSQTYRDYEHLIIDGASSDNTIELVNQAGDERIAIHSQKDTGIYHGMNRGLKYATGEYVIFLNSGDTFASPYTLEYYKVAIEKGYDIIYGDTYIVDNEGDYLRPRHLKAPKILTTESFLDGMLICHQAFMVRRSIAPKFDQNYRWSADYDWCIRCISKSEPGQCYNIERETIAYLDNGATEKNKIESLKERFHIMSQHYGKTRAILKHISFIPRAIGRKLRSLRPGAFE